MNCNTKFRYGWLIMLVAMIGACVSSPQYPPESQIGPPDAESISFQMAEQSLEREDWQQAWWLALAQRGAGESTPLASGQAFSPFQAVVRDTVQGLDSTPGGWPRVTARTGITPGDAR